MDLIKELKLMKSDGINDAINHIKCQKEIWDKKLHIFNVINLVDGLEKLIKDGFFDNHGVTKIKIYSTIHYTGTEIKFKLSDDLYQEFNIPQKSEDYFKYEILKNLFDELEWFNPNHIDEKFDFYINFKFDFKRDIFDKMLSEELKKRLEYSEMHVEVLQNKDFESKTKKPKI